MAARQDGLIAAWELRALGVTAQLARRWVAKGLLHELHPAVYAFGHRTLTLRGRLRAAIMAGGKDAVLSHRSAAGWWGMVDGHPETVDVSTPRARRPTSGIRFHRPRSLALDARTHHEGLPITSPARTLLDFAATTRNPHRLQKAIAGAQRESLLDMPTIERLPRGHNGYKRLRDALADYRAELAWTRSEIEDRAVLALADAGLPPPQVNVLVDGVLVDLWWPCANLAVELDSYRFHATQREFQRDREKGNALVDRRLLRFTWADVVHRTPRFVGEIAAKLRRPQSAAGTPFAARSPERTAPFM